MDGKFDFCTQSDKDYVGRNENYAAYMAFTRSPALRRKYSKEQILASIRFPIPISESIRNFGGDIFEENEIKPLSLTQLSLEFKADLASPFHTAAIGDTVFFGKGNAIEPSLELIKETNDTVENTFVKNLPSSLFQGLGDNIFNEDICETLNGKSSSGQTTGIDTETEEADLLSSEKEQFIPKNRKFLRSSEKITDGEQRMPYTVRSLRPKTVSQSDYNHNEGWPLVTEDEHEKVPVTFSPAVNNDINVAKDFEKMPMGHSEQSFDIDQNTVPTLFQNSSTVHEVPLEQPSSNYWCYIDSLKSVRGNFSAFEMFHSFMAGYLTEDTMIKRASDENFFRLGDLINLYGPGGFFHFALPFPNNQSPQILHQTKWESPDMENALPAYPSDLSVAAGSSNTCPESSVALGASDTSHVDTLLCADLENLALTSLAVPENKIPSPILVEQQNDEEETAKHDKRISISVEPSDLDNTDDWKKIPKKKKKPHVRRNKEIKNEINFSIDGFHSKNTSQDSKTNMTLKASDKGTHMKVTLPGVNLQNTKIALDGVTEQTWLRPSDRHGNVQDSHKQPDGHEKSAAKYVLDCVTLKFVEKPPDPKPEISNPWSKTEFDTAPVCLSKIQEEECVRAKTNVKSSKQAPRPGVSTRINWKNEPTSNPPVNFAKTQKEESAVSKEAAIEGMTSQKKNKQKAPLKQTPLSWKVKPKDSPVNYEEERTNEKGIMNKSPKILQQLKWNASANISPVSLMDIQKEEARILKERKIEPKQNKATVNNANAKPGLTWANWNISSNSVSSGFWDVEEDRVSIKENARHTKESEKKNPSVSNVIPSDKTSRKEDDALVAWVESEIERISGNALDGAQLIEFVRKIASEEEAENYLCELLGNSDSLKTFAKELYAKLKADPLALQQNTEENNEGFQEISSFRKKRTRGKRKPFDKNQLGFL